MVESVQELLAEVAAQVKACTSCPLHASRTQAVPGEGLPSARVAFIGEAPGAEEDRQGRPFVGRSGQLLRRTIVKVGWSEDEVFIGNVLKCRPPENRDPLSDEIAACSHYLEAQLVLIKPKVIVTLGRYSMNLLISPSYQISKIRGQHILKDGQLFLPTYHPSAVLRNNNLLREFEMDLLRAKKLSEQ
jgi:uracil-DNA glycosylase